MTITGSCLCGTVKYRLEGPAELINHCHCTNCRKAHGTAFGSFLHAAADGFAWLSGADVLTTYRSSELGFRAFCSVCGSSMPMVHEAAGRVIIPAGTLDDDPGLKPAVHFFVRSKAPWYEITDSLEQFDEFPSQEWISSHSGGEEPTP